MEDQRILHLRTLVQLSMSVLENRRGGRRSAKSAITAGHPILGVFFYEEAVRVADSSLPRNLQYQWQSLKQTQDIDLHACIGAATRRSLAEESVKEDDSIEANHLAEGFSLSGLGELAEMTANADRVIRFGG